jgi:hypothetical protein
MTALGLRRAQLLPLPKTLDRGTRSFLPVCSIAPSSCKAAKPHAEGKTDRNDKQCFSTTSRDAAAVRERHDLLAFTALEDSSVPEVSDGHT